MTIYLHDGVEFDLDCEFVDVTGVVWSWTGGWSAAGEPLLRSDASGPDLPLPDVYLYHGPLIPRRRRVTVKPGAAFAATVADGYVESDAKFGARIGGRP
ncbi:phiSA1p31-related protein [Streptomyces goshikiensis]|uniref:phiSA1p31-related protein n=1 Tax=Streptomyces goshikiensis TaxID=1942 RepID=UPI003662B5A6